MTECPKAEATALTQQSSWEVWDAHSVYSEFSPQRDPVRADH